MDPRYQRAGMTEKATPLLLTKEGNFTDRDCGSDGARNLRLQTFGEGPPKLIHLKTR